MALHSSPTPEELLQGAIASLRSVVAPDLTDPVAVDRLRSVIALLDYLRRHWDRASTDLAEEAAAIARVLTRAGRPLPDAPSGPGYASLVGHVDALHEALLAAVLEAADAPPGSALAGALPALRAELAATVQRRV